MSIAAVFRSAQLVALCASLLPWASLAAQLAEARNPIGVPGVAEPRGTRSGALVFKEAVPRLIVGHEFRFAVALVTRNGRSSPLNSVLWSSSSPEIASVSDDGVVRGLRQGRTFITATAAERIVRVRVTVLQERATPSIASVEITPDSPDMELGSSVQLVSTARSANGTVVATASSGWRSRDTTIAIVTADGLLRPRATGSTEVEASVGGIRASTVVRVRPARVVSLEVKPASLTLEAGGTAAVSAGALRRDGSVVDGSLISLSSRRGAVRGRTYTAPASAGVDTITATAPDGVSAIIPVTVQPHAASVIDLRLVRFDSSTESVLVSSGVPLAPGQLRDTDLGKVRLTVNGREVPIHVAALHGRHRDGTVRSLLLQVEFAIPEGGIAAQLALDATPTLARRAPAPPQAVPAAMALPHVDQLIKSELVGKATPFNAAAPLRIDAMFMENADRQWQTHGADWANMNYYDRVLNHTAFWVRSGMSSYLRRALQLAVDYRQKYIVESGFNPAPWWSKLEGLALHYWLTGDEQSRVAVLRSTDQLMVGYPAHRMARLDYEYLDGRVQGRLLIGNTYSYLLGGGAKYLQSARDYIQAIASTMRVDGSFAWPPWGGKQGNFMVALQNDALIKYAELVGDHPSIIPTLQRSTDFLWSTQWDRAAGAFRYVSGPCGNSNGCETSPDLNMLFASSFAYLGKRTGQPIYQQRADEITNGAIRGAWIWGTKQFNQFYYTAHHYLAFRH